MTGRSWIKRKCFLGAGECEKWLISVCMCRCLYVSRWQNIMCFICTITSLNIKPVTGFLMYYSYLLHSKFHLCYYLIWQWWEQRHRCWMPYIKTPLSWTIRANIFYSIKTLPCNKEYLIHTYLHTCLIVCLYMCVC